MTEKVWRSAAKLTQEDAALIKDLLADGWKATEIAEHFGVVPGTISAVKCNLTWSKPLTPRKPVQRKLNLEKALQIKRLLKQDIPRKEIAKDFNISVSTVNSIGRGETWKSAQLETFDDEFNIGSNQLMSHSERYNFVKNRTYSESKNGTNNRQI